MGLLDPEFTGTVNTPSFSYDYPFYEDPVWSDEDTFGSASDPTLGGSAGDFSNDIFDFVLRTGDKVVNYQTQLAASRGKTAPTSSDGFFGGGVDYTKIALIFGGLFLLSRLV